MVKFPQKGFIRKNLILKLFFSFWTACQLKLCPVLRNRSDSLQDPRFPGFRLRSIARSKLRCESGNPLARAPPIGRRLGFGKSYP